MRSYKLFTTDRLSVLIGLALAGSAIGCGSANNQAAAPPASTTQPQQAAPTGPFCTSGVKTKIGDVEVCKTTNYVMGGASAVPATYYSGYNWFPKLNPSNPAGPSAYGTGFNLKPHDVVYIAHSGSWGGLDVSSKSYLGGFINVSFSSWDCSMFTTRGIGDDGLVTYEGQPAGILISDTVQTYAPNSSGKVLIQGSGALGFGLNVPPSSNALCAGFSVTQIRVTRCEDAQGTTYQCPGAI